MCVFFLPYCTINVESTVFLCFHLLSFVEYVFVFIIPFFAVLKRFVVCMCDFVGFEYGIFIDFWIQFREYAFDDTIVFVWVFSEIVTFEANRNNSTVCNRFI